MESSEMRRAAWQRIRPAGDVERLHAGEGWESGIAAVDAAIDSGAGVVLLLDASSPGAKARAIAALHSNADATTVVSGTASDLDWMQLCTDVRDAMVVMRPLVGDASSLLAAEPQLSAMVASIVKAAARRTPIVIAGALPHIAAMAAQRIASQSSVWAFSALDDADAAARAAQKRLGIQPWASVEWLPGDAVVEALVRALVSDLDQA